MTARLRRASWGTRAQHLPGGNQCSQRSSPPNSRAHSTCRASSSAPSLSNAPRSRAPRRWPPACSSRPRMPAARRRRRTRRRRNRYPEHCRLTMVLKPTPDSNINVELWLPTQNWNGKFLAVGNGGWAGAIQGYGDMQEALRRGYATAGTDTGHSAADGPAGMFALGHPGEDRRLRVSRAARHDREVEEDDRCLLLEAARLLLLQGLLDGRPPGRHGRAALPRRLRRHHRGRAREPAHPHAHGRRVSRACSSRCIPSCRSAKPKAKLVNDAVHEQVRHAARGLPEQSAHVLVRLRVARVQSRRSGDTCLTPGELKIGADLLRRREEQQGRADLLRPGARRAAAAARWRSKDAPNPFAFDSIRILGFQNANYDWHEFDLDRDMPKIDATVGLRRRRESGSARVQGGRRQAAAVRRLARHRHHAGKHRAVLRERAQGARARAGRVDADVPRARHGPLPRRSRASTRSIR